MTDVDDGVDPHRVDESTSALDELRQAMERGDHRAARRLLASLDLPSLADAERAEAENIRDLITPDPAATVVAVVLGIFLLIIAILLFA